MVGEINKTGENKYEWIYNDTVKHFIFIPYSLIQDLPFFNEKERDIEIIFNKDYKEFFNI